MFTVIFFDEKGQSIIANAKIMITFFKHLHVLIMRDVRNVRNIEKKRKTSVQLNRCWSIQIVIEILYLRRWSKILEKMMKKLQKIIRSRMNNSRVSDIKIIQSLKKILKNILKKADCSRK